MALFAFSSPAGGLAETQTLLIAARAVQGLGGALLFPATLALVNTTFEEGPARNRALGVWSGAGASGLALGSLLGGLLTGVWGWQAIFYVNVPLAAIAIAGSYLLIPADDPRTRGRRFDLPSAVLATAGVSLLAFALIQGPETGWTSPSILNRPADAGTKPVGRVRARWSRCAAARRCLAGERDPGGSGVPCCARRPCPPRSARTAHARCRVVGIWSLR